MSEPEFDTAHERLTTEDDGPQTVNERLTTGGPGPEGQPDTVHERLSGQSDDDAADDEPKRAPRKAAAKR